MKRRFVLYFSILFTLAILAGYAYVYQFSPFSDEWNNFLIDAADPFVALLGAIAVTAVLLCYDKKDKPYSVWLYFAIGMWAWTFSEIIWAVVYFTSGEVPPLGVWDALWLGGYALFTLALHSQYQLVYQTKISGWKLIAIWVGIILLTLAILFLLNTSFTLENFVNSIYPLLDFALCIASIRLFMTFGGGKLSRPWIGLMVMGISDAAWAWLNATGQYQASSDAGTWLSVFADTTYVAAYLILAIGFLTQYLLLRFGPEGSV
jgi:hypothetical protein